MNQASFKASRSLLRLRGNDTAQFLNGLVTNSMLDMREEEARFAALLTPQGKIIADFFVVKTALLEGDAYFLDVPQALANDLLRKLTLYRLRAKVTIDDVSEQFGIISYQGDHQPNIKETIAFRDPRHEGMGWRVIAPREAFAGIAATDLSVYDALRIAHCVPEGGRDFAYGDAFPHEVNMDLLNGLNFKKGCYVGQEVVSRMHHRGTSRTRIVRVMFEAGVCFPEGTDIMGGDKRVGTLGTCLNGEALAQVRLDRAQDAVEGPVNLTAGGNVLRLN
jgi:folate-binding protein YgfZ